MGGGISDWHKKQRKKELAKNKEARIKSRDEKVLQSKTSDEIQKEIATLEKQFGNKDTRPHQIQMKLDRLNKELKLVTKKEAEQPKQRSKPAAPQPHSNFVELANPAVSVYYDAVLNPFGAPPPGKPNLYHRLGGGTTMNLNESGFPGQAPPPPPPPPPPHPHKDSVRPNVSRPSEKGHRTDGQWLVQTKKEPSQPKNQPQQSSEPFDPNKVPDLPKPSRAVERSKRKLNVDIWASNEEVEYETKMENHHHKTWFYQDTSGTVQGPFETQQMKEWYKAGYFPNTTLVCGTHANGPWKAYSKTKQLQKTKTKKRSEKSKIESSVHSRIGALRGEKPVDSVQSRIAALKRTDQQQVVEDPLALPEESADDMQHRIAAQRQTADKARDDDDDDGSTSSVQKRIAALKNDQQGPDQEIAVDAPAIGPEIKPAEVSTNSNPEPEVPTNSAATEPGMMMPPSPPPPVTESEMPLYPVESSESMVPPPPSPPRAGNESELPAYPVADGPMLPPPPPQAAPMVNVPSYPVDNDSVVAPYPVDEGTAEGSVVAPYPTSNQDDSYPAVGEYPVDEDGIVAETQQILNLPPKKKAKVVKVDKEIVAFLPSHLRRPKKKSTKL